MSNLLSYSGVVTKSRAMGKYTMNQDDYMKISSLETVSSFIGFLKTKPTYSPYFSGLDEQSLHRGEIERIIKNAVLRDYEKIFYFSTGKQRNFLKLLFFRYEINTLKACLIRVFNKDEVFDLGTSKSFFEQHSKLPVDQLVAANTMEEFINLLKDTDYYRLFHSLYQNGHSTLFDYEIQLDVFFFTTAWKKKNKLLKGEELEAYTICLGKEIDLLNIMWIYRSKKFYDVDVTKIISVIIPISYKLKKTQLTQLIETSSIEDFFKVLHTTSYHIDFGNENDIILEKLYFQTLHQLYKEIKRRYPFSMAPIQCHLFLKEREIDKLTTALECIRYHLEPNAILQYVL